MCMSVKNKGQLLGEQQLERINVDFTKDPVVAVHCKAGKGRTGLIICCFMLLTGVFDNVEDCLRHYDLTRTTDGKALTIQS